ncbi:hypothetical protein H072_5867 [Dactylellina haptotyla CBS 200.50]|uniref:Cystathionine gamma-synthase n=1 Tax=Dactylellina haptotyla (strain CBS 200.50) TaxID=1284197 RepID=S8ABI8_DACHA|nr:hypothetical protein H072_5867 [Dactylellina haptotyla CBS 200.50]
MSINRNTLMEHEATLGEAIPSDTEHAISVSLPTWRSNVGYEENEDWVVSKMKSGYPRYRSHTSCVEIAALERSILDKHGLQQECCMIFPSALVAATCKSFIGTRSERCTDDGKSEPPIYSIRVASLASSLQTPEVSGLRPDIWVIFVPNQLYKYAREFWQHTGEGISSRRAVFAHTCLNDGQLLFKEHHDASPSNPQLPRGPSRYSRYNSGETGCNTNKKNIPLPVAETTITHDFVEMRYGRNLEASAAKQAKSAIKQRISGIIGQETSAGVNDFVQRRERNITSNDVFLFPTGMSAIYNTHKLIQELFGPCKMVEFGFPYLDTLKILQKFGDGCLFFGNGDDQDLDQLEKLLQNERISGLFCEFPSNPLLRTPDIRRLRSLANKHHFVIVVDETIGNFVNVDVLPYADILVSSLTKVFSGDSNVMGGSCVLNPKLPYYSDLSKLAKKSFEDNYWDEDAIFMERNSRDFASRVYRINENAENLATLLFKSQLIKKVYYPKYADSRENYDACKCNEGGYGGLLSVTFDSQELAMKFYDLVTTAKGPSLGTNFTLTSPYALLAHYKELDWVAQYGVESHLIRISVGLERKEVLLSKFETALQEVAASAK